MNIKEKPFFTQHHLKNEARTYSFSNQPSLKKYWPSVVQGLAQPFCLFKNTRTTPKLAKKIPLYGDVVVGERYYVLTKYSLNSSLAGVTISPTGRKSSREEENVWNLYILTISENSTLTQKFANRLGFNLTNDKPLLIPMWPPYVLNSNLLNYERDINNFPCRKFLFTQGDVVFKLYPSNEDANRLFSNSIPQYSMAEIQATGRDQLVFLGVGRNDAFKCFYIQERPLPQQAPSLLPQVDVTDNHNAILKEDKYPQAPKWISITSEFDGFLSVVEKNVEVCRYPLQAGKPYQYSPKLDQILRIYAGLDCVREILFGTKIDTKIDTKLEPKKETKKESKTETRQEEKHAEKVATQDESSLLKTLQGLRGREIVVPHSYGALIRDSNKYPKVQLWFYKQITQGNIDCRALQIVKSLFK